MTDYVMRALGIPAAEADALRARYWQSYGTTLAGLMREHGARPRARTSTTCTTSTCRRVPAAPDAVRRASGGCPGASWSTPTARASTRAGSRGRCGLEGCFDALYGFEDAGYRAEARGRGLRDGLRARRPGAARRAAMFEDDPRNLAVPHRLGMRTVLVGPAAAHPHVHHQTEDLGRASSRAARLTCAGTVETDVLVAGGGVAGLTAAAAFASAGFRVVCVDPVPPVTSAEAEGSDLRSTAFLMPAVGLLERAGLLGRGSRPMPRRCG